MKNLLEKLNSITPDYNLELEVLRIIKHNTNLTADGEELKENINYILRYWIHQWNLLEFIGRDTHRTLLRDYSDDIKNFLVDTNLNVLDFITANSNSYFDLIENERELAELIFIAVLKNIIEKNPDYGT